MEMPRESIFISSLRALCKAFAIIIGIFIAMIPLFLLMSVFDSGRDTSEKTILQVLPDLDGNIRHTPEHSPVILQINVQGVIGEPSLNSETVKRQLVDSRHGLLSGNRVKAILLNIDTPGGTVKDSEGIYQLIKAYKAKYDVPVYSYVDGLCASGGMYIACSSDEVFASPISTIGSVGVVLGPFFNVSDGLSKIGIEALTLTQGKDKDMLNPVRPWKAGEDASIKAVMGYLYKRFVHVVSSNRPKLTTEILVDDLGARVYDSPEAERLGYIDHSMSTYDDAVQALMAKAGIEQDEPYQIVELEPKKSVLADLIQGKSPIFSGRVDHVHHLGKRHSHSIQDQFAYLYQPGASNP